MTPSKELAHRLREVILNGQWIANTNFKQAVEKMDWQMANRQISNLNTIALLVQHIHYYIGGVLQVFKGGTLDIRDQYSFDFPPIGSQEDWENRLTDFFNDAENLAQHIEKMKTAKLEETFVDEKYGTYSRNLNALIEHAYYHLGQVSLIKKMLDG